MRRGKGGKPGRQPLALELPAEPARQRVVLRPPGEAAVFCGLEGKRVQPTILAAIIRRAAQRARLDKRVAAHTLRQGAATWLGQETGDARLVAAYPGYAALSTVSRYAHVAAPELPGAAAAITARGRFADVLPPAAAVPPAVWSVAGTAPGRRPGVRAARFHETAESLPHPYCDESVAERSQ